MKKFNYLTISILCLCLCLVSSNSICHAETNEEVNIEGTTLFKNDKLKSVLDEKMNDLAQLEYARDHYNAFRFVKIAEAELGATGGEKYSDWFGWTGHHAWCAIFVSWCAAQVNLLYSEVPKFALVPDGKDWYIERGKWLEGGNVPEAGMVVFFDYADERWIDGILDGCPDHVGIVKEVKDGYVYTIEGNKWDKCVEWKYKIDSPYLNGYGIIDFHNPDYQIMTEE